MHMPSICIIRIDCNVEYPGGGGVLDPKMGI